MMQLSTRSKMIDSNTAEVTWTTGELKNGIMRITLKDRDMGKDAAVAAELCAIYNLIFEKSIFGSNNLYSGVGYKLSVSHGAIKKLIKNKSDKKALWHYAAFLKHRLDGVLIETSHSMKGMPSRETEGVILNDVIVDQFSFERNYNTVISPAIGEVTVTQHAIDMYIERTTTGKPKDPLKSFMKQILNPNLVLNTLDEKILAHKKRKHGRSDNIELWSGSTSELKFLVVKDGCKKTIVTCFEVKKPQLKSN